MSEYVRKQALVEWLEEAIQRLRGLEIGFRNDGDDIGARDCRHDVNTLHGVKAKIQSGAFDANGEVQRLRAAAIKLHETLNTFWQNDCDKADVVNAQSNPCEALSTTSEPIGAERAKAAIADRYKNALHGWHNHVDRAAGSYYNGYLNGVGDTLRLLDITIPGINAAEKEGRT